MAGSDKFINSVKKDLQKKESMPDTMEIMEDAYAGINASVQSSRMYGADGFEVVGLQKGLYLYPERSAEDDLRVREAIRRNKLIPLQAPAWKDEVDFRQKEQCYKEKERDQEKAAGERMKDLSWVDTDLLTKDATALETSLAEAIDPADSYAAAKRSYETKYLAAIRDLIDTQNSKGKFFGNYKKHIALAKEKYLFYKDNAHRIIGREMFAVLAGKDQYKAKTDEIEQAHANAGTVPAVDLTRLLDQDQNARAKIDGMDKKEKEQLRKAIIEYKESASKAYELQVRLQAFTALNEEETRARIDAAFANDQKLVRDVRFALGKTIEPANITDQMVKAEIAEKIIHHDMAATQTEYERVMEAEIRALKFHADSSLLCVRLLLSKGDPQAMQLFNANADVLFSHAGYLEKHFGVSFPSANDKLRSLKLAGRVGFESGESDLSVIMETVAPQAMRDQFAPELHRAIESANTGYLKQQAFEDTIIKYSVDRVFTDLVARQPGEDQNSLREECEATTLLTRPLPGLRRVNKVNTGQDAVFMNFLGTRDKKGEFHPAIYNAVNPQEYNNDILPAFEQHVLNLRSIRMSQDPQVLKEAIRAELGTVEEAFGDIDAFMSVGQSREIFQGKSHEDVFFNTAGLPTFARKARGLRDLISRMVGHPDLLSQLEQEQGKELKKNLAAKLVFMNRVVRFVQNRIALMDKGYDATLVEWSEDTASLQGFWDGDVPAAKLMDENATGDFLELVHGLAQDQRQRQQEDDEDQPQDQAAVAEIPKTAEELAADARREAAWDTALNKAQISAHDKATMPLSKYERSAFATGAQQYRALLADLMKLSSHPSIEDAQKMADALIENVRHPSMLRREEDDRRWDAALRDLPELERRYLRKQYYEESCATREEQRDAVESDLLKGTIHADCLASRTAVEAELKKLEEVERNGTEAEKRNARTQMNRLRGQKDDLTTVIDTLRQEVRQRAEGIVGMLKAPIALPTQAQVATADLGLLRQWGSAQRVRFKHVKKVFDSDPMGELRYEFSWDLAYEVSLRAEQERLMYGPNARSGFYDAPRIQRMDSSQVRMEYEDLRQAEVTRYFREARKERAVELLRLVGADVNVPENTNKVLNLMKQLGNVLPTANELLEMARLVQEGQLLQVGADIGDSDAALMKIEDLLRQSEQIRLRRVRNMLVLAGEADPHPDLVREGERLLRLQIVPSFNDSIPQDRWPATQARLLREELETEGLERAKEVALMLKQYPTQADVEIVRDALREQLGREILSMDEIALLGKRLNDDGFRRHNGFEDYLKRADVEVVLSGMRAITDEKRAETEGFMRAGKADASDAEIDEAVRLQSLRLGRVLTPDQTLSGVVEQNILRQNRFSQSALVPEQRVVPADADAAPAVAAPAAQVLSPDELTRRKAHWETAVGALGAAGQALMRTKFPDGCGEDHDRQKSELIHGILADTTYKLTQADLKDNDEDLAACRNRLAAGGLSKEETRELKEEEKELQRNHDELAKTMGELESYADSRAEELLSMEVKHAPSKKQGGGSAVKPSRLRFDGTVEEVEEKDGLLEVSDTLLEEREEFPKKKPKSIKANRNRSSEADLRTNAVVEAANAITGADQLVVFTSKERRIAEHKITQWLREHALVMPANAAEAAQILGEHGAQSGPEVAGYLEWLRRYHQMFADDRTADRAAFERDYAPVPDQNDAEEE